MIAGLPEACPREVSLEMFHRICKARFFDEQAYRACEKNLLKALIYLSAGQESIAAAVSTVITDSHLFTQHRGHAPYLCFGGDPIKLIDELLGLPSGCCGGMGGSPCIQDPEIRMIGHEGLIGEHVPIAVGAALGNPEATVICFFGDGAVEEDYFLGALGFAATRKLRVLFVCEDNDLSVLTPTSDRRTWHLHDVARSFGMESVDITDDPWLIRHHTLELSKKGLPALLNCRTCRLYWHVGAGQDGVPEWDRFALVKQTLEKLGLGAEAQQIEEDSRKNTEALWKSRLLIPSVK